MCVCVVRRFRLSRSGAAAAGGGWRTDWWWWCWCWSRTPLGSSSNKKLDGGKRKREERGREERESVWKAGTTTHRKEKRRQRRKRFFHSGNARTFRRSRHMARVGCRAKSWTVSFFTPVALEEDKITLFFAGCFCVWSKFTRRRLRLMTWRKKKKKVVLRRRLCSLTAVITIEYLSFCSRLSKVLVIFLFFSKASLLEAA